MIRARCSFFKRSLVAPIDTVVKVPVSHTCVLDALSREPVWRDYVFSLLPPHRGGEPHKTEKTRLVLSFFPLTPRQGPFAARVTSADCLSKIRVLDICVNGAAGPPLSLF